MRTSYLALPLAALAGLPLAAKRSETAAEGRGFVAVKAGTIHLVQDGRVIEGGGTILVKDNRIHSVGKDLNVPLDAQVVDYGPGAVIIPGLVSADSGFGTGSASSRTAEPGLSAIDNFDFFATNATTLASGVTTVYVHPSSMRLVSGEGAVVKLAGDDEARRVLRSPAAISGAIHSGARNTSGYWDPPVPATVDVGIGYAKEQLPKSAMGAIVALTELVTAARDGESLEEIYGPYAVPDLAARMESGLPWRITAQTESEIRALLDFAGEHDIPLVIDEATEANYVADEIAKAGAAVVYQLPFSPNRRGVDRGKGKDVRWPTYDVPAALVAAGVRVAITSTSTSDLLFAAAAAGSGKLDPAAALRAITLTPAEIYGVDGRVGSIHPGKDADFVVLNGPPIALGATVTMTWVDGKVVWSAEASGEAAQEDGKKKTRSRTVAVQVDELHLGDGRVLSPGQVVIKNGKITSVTEGHSRPSGAAIVKGVAAMPGIVDAFGHLGLEGSSKVPATDYKLKNIIAPGDATDRRVAKAGITTVAMTPRGTSSSGAPIMAYKPASGDPGAQVVADPAALRVKWSETNRSKSGEAVRGLLEKGKSYRDKWIEYEKAIAAWVPPPPEPEKEEDEDDDEKKDDDEAEEDDKKDDDKKKKGKKKKKDEEEVEPDPITGVWEAEVDRPPLADAERLRMQLKLEVGEGGGSVEGNLRCVAVADGLIDVDGFYDAEAKALALKGLGSQGWVSIQAEYDDATLEGTITVGANELDLEAKRTSRDYVVAGRSERRAVTEEKVKEPKGKPKKPRVDSKLEPMKAALEGRVTVIVDVAREDEILACVDAFEQYGIQPVLYGARDAHYVADDLAGRVRGVLLSHSMKIRDSRTGTDVRNPYAQLQDAGIPVAFHSAAEEGAIDLPMMAMYAVANGMSTTGALRALTADAADMLSIGDHVGRIEVGADGDLLLLDGPPLAPGTSVVRVWVNGEEVH